LAADFFILNVCVLTLAPSVFPRFRRFRLPTANFLYYRAALFGKIQIEFSARKRHKEKGRDIIHLSIVIGITFFIRRSFRPFLPVVRMYLVHDFEI
jgi:hypothetical protein